MIPFIRNPFAATKTEYPKGLPSPNCAPTLTPVNVPISCYWLPYVAGACKALLQEAAWNLPDDTALIQTLGWVDDLLAIFAAANAGEGCASLGPPFACPFDIEVDGAGWAQTAFGAGATPSFGSDLVPGTGYVSVEETYAPVPGRTYVKAACELTFTATVLTDVIMGYDLVKGSFDVDDGNQTGILIQNGGVNVATQLVHSSSDPDGSGKSIGWTGSVTADKIILLVQCANRLGSTSDGSAVIRTAEVNGTGPTVCGPE